MVPCRRNRPPRFGADPGGGENEESTMEAMRSRLGFHVTGSPCPLARAPLVVATALIAAGPAARQGPPRSTQAASTTTSTPRHRRRWSGADLFVTNGWQQLGDRGVGLHRGVRGQDLGPALQVPPSVRHRGGRHRPLRRQQCGQLRHRDQGERTSSTSARSAGPSTTSPTPSPWHRSVTDLFVLNGAGSLTEIAAGNGALLGTVSGPAFGFHRRRVSPSPTDGSSWPTAPATPSP